MSKYHSYCPEDGHGLKYSPFKALVAPRPIGWISTLSATGSVNLAPYSYFNAYCERPPILGFVSDGRKDSLINSERTGEFVYNVAPMALADQMSQTSAPLAADQSEVAAAGLTTIASDLVAVPRLAEGPAAMECKLIEIKTLRGRDGAETSCHLVLGEVVRIHIDKDYLNDGVVDEEKLGLVGRLGYFNYAAIHDVFSMKRPK